MNDDAARSVAESRLARVIERHGPQIVQDRSRLTGLLRDAMMNEHRPLLSMLLRTLDEDVPATLLRSATDARPYRVVESDLVDRVVQNTMSSPEAVAWAVQAWAKALGVGESGEKTEDATARRDDALKLTERREQRADPKPDPKTDPKPDPKPQPKPEPKPDPKPDPDPAPMPWFRTPAAIAGAIATFVVIALAMYLRPSPGPDVTPTASPTFAAFVTAGPTLNPYVSTMTHAPYFTLPTEYTCPMTSPTLRETFSVHNNAWDPMPTTGQIFGGYYHLTPRKGHSAWDFYDAPAQDALICTSVSNTLASSLATADDSAAGVAFWSGKFPGESSSLIYAFVISPNGRFGVWRLEHNVWSAVIGTTSSRWIHTGMVGANVLTVRTHASIANFYINGHWVGSIHASHRGSYDGLLAETSEHEGSAISWRFGYFAYRL